MNAGQSADGSDSIRGDSSWVLSPNDRGEETDFGCNCAALEKLSETRNYFSTLPLCFVSQSSVRNPTGMNLEHAEHSLDIIRTLMERSQRYEHISGLSGLAAGTLVLIGAAALQSDMLPWSSPINSLVVWSLVLAVSVMVHLLITRRRARDRGEALWTRQARTVLLALLPAFIVAAVISVWLWTEQRTGLWPSIWLLLYGCGTLATCFFAPRSILFLGLTCLTAGILSLLVLTDHPLLTMSIGFGLTHIAYGLLVLRAERIQQREQEWLGSCQANSIH
jgi:hypothetical protein